MRVQAMIGEIGGDGMAETEGQKYLQHLSILPLQDKDQVH